MKKTILYATLLALSFQSCDYLDREPLDSVTKDQFLRLRLVLPSNNIVTTFTQN